MKKGDFLPRVDMVCPCGKEFKVRQKRAEKGYGKYCSQKCKYKYRVRPTGLHYKIIATNKGWIKNGQEPWNKGRTDLPRPVNFKNEGVGYWALHDWVNRHKGKALKCEHCQTELGRIEWANKSHEYKRDLSDWISLCKKCHIKYDKKSWGVATKKYNLPKRVKRLS